MAVGHSLEGLNCASCANIVTVGRAIILSRLDYCNSLLYGTSQSNIDRLQHIQNQVVRIIKKLPPRSHVSEHRVALHWLPVKERILYKMAVLTFVARSSGQPSYLAEQLTGHTTGRQLRSTADTSRLTVPLVKTKSAACAFRVAAPTVWNNLPQSIRDINSIDKFKAELKTFLFAQC